MKKLRNLVTALSTCMLLLGAIGADAQDAGSDSALRKACEEDLDKHCAEAERQPEMLVACLTAHQADLSESCRAHLAAQRQKPDQNGEK